MASKSPPEPSNRNVKSQQWEVNSIRISHNIGSYPIHQSFSASNPADLVRLHFGLKGDYWFSYKQLGRKFDLIGGHHNLMYSNGLDIEVHNKTNELETFGVNFPKELFIQLTQNGDDLLKRFHDQILGGRGAIISENWGSMRTPIQGVIDEILQNSYAGELKNIFLFAKSLELLVLCVDNYRELGQMKPTHLRSKSDKEKVMAARDYVNQRISSPPHLSDIARTVGLNEFKLKYGFKEMFGTTIFGYLTDRRLNLAKQHLLNTQKTAAEIAFELGYSSPQHFSNQFRKKFGKAPNSIRNNA